MKVIIRRGSKKVATVFFRLKVMGVDYGEGDVEEINELITLIKNCSMAFDDQGTITVLDETVAAKTATKNGQSWFRSPIEIEPQPDKNIGGIEFP